MTEFLAGYALPPGVGMAGDPDLKASQHSTGGALSVFETTIGAGPPLHVHDREDECFYVLDGELSVRCASSLNEPARTAARHHDPAMRQARKRLVSHDVRRYANRLSPPKRSPRCRRVLAAAGHVVAGQAGELVKQPPGGQGPDHRPHLV
jgi:hypothetical protein